MIALARRTSQSMAHFWRDLEMKRHVIALIATLAIAMASVPARASLFLTADASFSDGVNTVSDSKFYQSGTSSPPDLTANSLSAQVSGAAAFASADLASGSVKASGSGTGTATSISEGSGQAKADLQDNLT